MAQVSSLLGRGQGDDTQAQSGGAAMQSATLRETATVECNLIKY